MSTHIIDHPTLGPVTVTERKGSGKLSARWKEGHLRINIPAGATRRQMEQAIERHREDFERIRPRPRYTVGTVIPIAGAPDTPDSTASSGQHFEIRIESTPKEEMDILLQTDGQLTIFHILVPQHLDIGSPDIQKRINGCVKTAARRLAPPILLHRARQLASWLGLRVDRWEIAHGQNVLGTCYPRQRRIRLSYINIFLTPELRDYIILHELAHLTEAGHTPAFHALCDSYCRGRESTLINQLHSFSWPVER